MRLFPQQAELYYDSKVETFLKLHDSIHCRNNRAVDRLNHVVNSSDQCKLSLRSFFSRYIFPIDIELAFVL